MTDATRELIGELRALPADEQETVAASFLADLRKRKKAQSKRERNGNGRSSDTLYDSFRVLKDAKLQLPPDASATYENELYGREGRSDEP